jgi:hypothetical protein
MRMGTGEIRAKIISTAVVFMFRPTWNRIYR